MNERFKKGGEKTSKNPHIGGAEWGDRQRGERPRRRIAASGAPFGKSDKESGLVGTRGRSGTLWKEERRTCSKAKNRLALTKSSAVFKRKEGRGRFGRT